MLDRRRSGTARANAVVELPIHLRYDKIEPDLPGTDIVLDESLKYPPPPEGVLIIFCAVVILLLIGVICVVPILITYPFLQRHFAKGVLTEAVKG